jgi:hypothetical protein
MGVILLISQASAAPAALAAAPPDIELIASVQAREMQIEQEGPIVLRLEVDPGITDVEVTRNQPAGATTYLNRPIAARVAAWLRQEDDGPLTLSTEVSTGEQPQ